MKDLIVGSRGVVFDCSSGYFHHAITASLGLADLSSVYAIVLHICWLSLCMKITVLCNVTLGGLRLARKASLTELSSHGKVRLPTIAVEHRISTNEWYDSMYWRSINQVSPRSNVFLSVKTPYCELCYVCFQCGGNHCQGELKVVCDSVVFLGVENQEAEPGARLTCHLLLRLLDESTDVMSHDHSSALKFPFKSSHDHHLLSAAHDSIRIGPVLAALKAMLKLSEAGMLYCSRSSSVCSFCSRSSVIVHVNERNSERAMLCFHDNLFFSPLCSFLCVHLAKSWA